MLRLLKSEGIELASPDETDFTQLQAEEEKELIDKLAAYPDEIASAAEHYDPSRLTRYAIELASGFHSFYNACHIKGVDEKLMKARLALAACVKTVLYSDLSLLGVEAPEKM